MNEHYTVESETYMDLYIEKVHLDEILVGHYWEQRGDLMADPEIVYKIEEWDYPISPDGWNPVQFKMNGFPSAYESDRTGLGWDTIHFCRKWDETLGKQGFVELAEQGHVEKLP